MQILLEFSLTWIRLIWLLSFHMPWYRLDSTFHYPIEEIYKEPFGYIEGIWGIESKKTIIHCCQNLCLRLHPLCPLKHFCVLPNISFCLWACYREMEEAQVGDSVSPIRRCTDRGCIHCNLWFYINRNIFSYPIMCVWMNILSIDVFKCLYIVDYICRSNTNIYSMHVLLRK